MAIRQENDSECVLETTGQVETLLLLSLWVCSCGVGDEGSYATGAHNCFRGASAELCSPDIQETEILSWFCEVCSVTLRKSASKCPNL